MTNLMARMRQNRKAAAAAPEQPSPAAVPAPAPATTPEPAAAVAPVPATGGASLMAKMRAGRVAAAVPAVPKEEQGAGNNPIKGLMGKMRQARKSTDAPSQPTEPPAAAPAAAAKPAAAATAKPLTGSAAVLARMRQDKAKADANVQKKVTVLYASQTGTCAEIAKDIRSQAIDHGLKADVASFDEFGFENINAQKSPVVVVVAASTGDGDPPDNSARAFAAARKKQPADALAGVTYTVLGLGDSNYTRFMHVPRLFKRKFADMGATELYKSVEADEVDGLEDVIDPWLEGLWKPLAKACDPSKAAAEGATASAPAAAATAVDPATLMEGLIPAAVPLEKVPALAAPRVKVVWETDSARASAIRTAESSAPSAEAAAHRDPEGLYSAEAPFWARVADCRALTTAKSKDREVLHLAVDISGAGMAYGPGDAIAVLPSNDAALVDALLGRLGLASKADDVFSISAADGSQTRLLPHLRWPATLRHALRVGADLTGPLRKSTLRALAEHASEEAEKRTLLFMCTKAGRDRFKKEMTEAQPSVLDVLNRYPSCCPPLDTLLDALPALAPRMYSLTSSPLEHKEEVQVAFSVVSYATANGTKEGVATNWLKAIAANGATPQLAIYLRRGGDFKPPADLTKPVIMIGPGTGVAPFRGFLQHRRQQLKTHKGDVGKTWLFFGCRKEDEDFLYKEDLQQFVKDGTLSNLCTAFSRAQADKVYVQHKMAERGQELAAAIAGGAYVYICGDGAHMAKDVHAALESILSKNGGMSAAQATEKLAEMAKTQRYVRDIWS